MMRDPILLAARDRSCRLCLVPWKGGSWMSLLLEGVVWPSSTPRNFAERYGNFNDFHVVAPKISTHDFKWWLDFQATNPENVYAFNSNSAGPGHNYNMVGYSCYSAATSTNSIGFCAHEDLVTDSVCSYYDDTIVSNASVDYSAVLATYKARTDRMKIEIRRTGTTVDIYIDDILAKTITGSGITPFEDRSIGCPASRVGYLYDSGLFDLTENKTIWSYPNTAERLQLITKENVRTDRGYFEAATPDAWTIQTAVAGASGTVLADINGIVTIDPPQWDKTTGLFTGASGDVLRWILAFDRTLIDAEISVFTEIKYWTIPCSAGTVSIETDGFANLLWTFPNGTTSTEKTINRTVTAGTITCRYTGIDADTGKLRINNSSALTSSEVAVIDLPRVTYYLYLTSLPGLTGNVVDLPRVTYYLNLNNLSSLTGNVADLPRVQNTLYLYNLLSLTGNVVDLPRVTYYLYLLSLSGLVGNTVDLPRVKNTLYLNNLSSLTGNVVDLPRVTYYLYLLSLSGLVGNTVDLPRVQNTLYLNNLSSLTGNAGDLPVNAGARYIYSCSAISGNLPVVSTNTIVYYYDNAPVTPVEYDRTIQNIVDAGGTNGTLHIDSSRTSASDSNIALLESRSWTVTEI